MKRATIFDYVRMCNSYEVCNNCPLADGNNGECMDCDDFIMNYPDKANKIILKWCAEHPAETRQDKLLKMFPNAPENGIMTIPPCLVEKDYTIRNCQTGGCERCKKEYWLAEVDE